jgi:pimeloyl-ACP methyl ester carboxylesterase
MIRLHEIIKIVADLQEQGEIELAYRLTGQYMDRLESGELRFNHLSLAAKLGRAGQVMDLLEGYLETNRWFSTWFLQRVPELKQLQDLPRYQGILQATEEREEQYWQDGVAKPLAQVSPSAPPPYPLLIAIHGNGFNPEHSASNWACAAETGWLVFHPMAKRLVGYGSHWWDTHEENREIIVEQAAEILQQYPIDYDRVVLGGFSKGGEVAMVLALQGWLGARGFIGIGAGGYYHMQPELWRPLLESPPRGLSGVLMYSPYDLERAGGENQTLKSLQAAGIEIWLEKYAAEGHVFPEDFPVRFVSAVEFVLRLTT